jgi:hypothetical protein
MAVLDHEAGDRAPFSNCGRLRKLSGLKVWQVCVRIVIGQPMEGTDMPGQNFQGTSNEGDFQSALLEAVNRALEALRGNTADARIAWRLIETSGSFGGILGERAITVTIEAQLS